MAKFRKKPVVIEAITFEQLVQHGKDYEGSNIVDGYPWSFKYNNHPITHKNNECYLIPTMEGTMQMTPNDMLITGVQGEIYPCKKDIFEATYDIMEEVAVDGERTFGELAVGINFNPSELSDVDKVKRDFANVIDLCNNTSTFTYLSNTLKGMAIRACIQAQMCVVKLITFKE